MKYALTFIVTLLILIIGLNQTVMAPESYSGQWYSADDQSIYSFHEGLIYCSKYTVALSDTDSISGAYSYCKDSIVLFAQGIDGLETEKEIYLVQNKDGSFLCENPDGTGKTYFIRCTN